MEKQRLPYGLIHDPGLIFPIRYPHTAMMMIMGGGLQWKYDLCAMPGVLHNTPYTFTEPNTFVNLCLIANLYTDCVIIL